MRLLRVLVAVCCLCWAHVEGTPIITTGLGYRGQYYPTPPGTYYHVPPLAASLYAQGVSPLGFSYGFGYGYGYGGYSLSPFLF